MIAQKLSHLGYRSFTLSNKSLELIVTESVGPRILSMRYKGGKNLFADLPNEVLDCPGIGEFHFYGGHRLWHAPENPARTYIPDDQPVEIVAAEKRLTATAQVEVQTGLEKSIKISIEDYTPKVTIQHILTNRGVWPVETAPWAITQLRTGGIAILPQSVLETASLPNRSLTLWPYTDMRDPLIEWGNQYIFVHAERKSGQLKLGFPNPRGWMAYWIDGTLFVKKAEYHPSQDYFDMGSSSECYCDHRFLELETIAPRQVITPGQFVMHTETWEVYGDIDFSPNEESAEILIRKLGLE